MLRMPVVVAARERAQPGFAQRNVLRCETGHRFDHNEIREILCRSAVGQQQVTYVVIRVAEHQAYVLESVADA